MAPLASTNRSSAAAARAAQRATIREVRAAERAADAHERTLRRETLQRRRAREEAAAAALRELEMRAELGRRAQASRAFALAGPAGKRAWRNRTMRAVRAEFAAQRAGKGTHWQADLELVRALNAAFKKYTDAQRLRRANERHARPPTPDSSDDEKEAEEVAVVEEAAPQAVKWEPKFWQPSARYTHDFAAAHPVAGHYGPDSDVRSSGLIEAHLAWSRHGSVSSASSPVGPVTPPHSNLRFPAAGAPSPPSSSKLDALACVANDTLLSMTATEKNAVDVLSSLRSTNVRL